MYIGTWPKQTHKIINRNRSRNYYKLFQIYNFLLCFALYRQLITVLMKNIKTFIYGTYIIVYEHSTE